MLKLKVTVVWISVKINRQIKQNNRKQDGERSAFLFLRSIQQNVPGHILSDSEGSSIAKSSIEALRTELAHASALFSKHLVPFSKK